MVAKVGGVQAKIKKYPKAAFVHCAAHRLNLVVNDLNSVSEVRNVIGTVKAIIKFIQESPKRRSLVPNVPMQCETRWTHQNLHQPLRGYLQTTTLYCYSFLQVQPRCPTVAMHIWNVDILVVPGYHGKIFSDVGASDTSLASCST